MVVGAAVEDYVAMDDDVGHPQSLEGSQRGIPEAAEIEDSREITGKLDDQNACFFVDSHAMNCRSSPNKDTLSCLTQAPEPDSTEIKC